MAKVTQDPVKLRSETLHALLAGRDTTGSTLGWVFYFLARHPRMLEKLRNEVASVSRRDTSPSKSVSRAYSLAST